jgi:antitoxin component of MazEF toxin-antitoxin module
MATKTRIVRIGNSRDIRVPKALLDQAQLPEEVDLRADFLLIDANAPNAGR